MIHVCRAPAGHVESYIMIHVCRPPAGHVESYIMMHVCRPPAGHMELSCGLTMPGVKPRPLYDHVCTHLCGFVASLPAHCFPVLVRW